MSKDMSMLPDKKDWILPHTHCPDHPEAPVLMHGCTVDGCRHNRSHHADDGHWVKAEAGKR